MDNEKKRKIPDGGKLDSEQLGPSSLSRSARKKGTHKHGRKNVNKEFLLQKKSLWQQGIEQINDMTIKYIDEATSDDQVLLQCCESLRLQAEMEALYKRPVGRAMSLGQDDASQLGINTNDDDEEKQAIYPPTYVKHVLEDIIQVAAGGMHSVALTNDGMVYSWGCNDTGSLGRKTKTEMDSTIPTELTDGFKNVNAAKRGNENESNEIVAVACGDSHTLYLSIHGNVYMSGMYKDSDSGEFRDVAYGDTETEGRNQIAVHVSRLEKPVRAIACGASFNAAILNDNSLVTWGMGHCGELARSADMTKPVIKNDGSKSYELGKPLYTEVYKDMEGNNRLRYLGKVVAEKFLTPKPPLWSIPFAGKRHVLSVACGGYHILVAARTEGQNKSMLYTSGINQYGQLGHGDTVSRHELTPVKALENENIVKMSAGEHFSVVLNLLGTSIFSFGRSDYGQLGLFDTAQRAGSFETTPKEVAFPDIDMGKDHPSRFIDIEAGDRHCIATTDKGTVYTWGFGETGTTGHDLPDDFDCNRPQKLDVLKQYKGNKKHPTHACVRNAAGGGQHSLLVVERFS